jgi:hypothetical protein
MQTGPHFEAFYVSWISLRKIYFMHIVRQDLRQNPDFAAIINVEGHSILLQSSHGALPYPVMGRGPQDRIGVKLSRPRCA